MSGLLLYQVAQMYGLSVGETEALPHNVRVKMIEMIDDGNLAVVCVMFSEIAHEGVDPEADDFLDKYKEFEQ